MRIKEQELGAEEADAFGTLLQRLDHLRHACGVGQHAKAMAVFGLRRLQPAGHRVLSGKTPALGLGAGVRNAAGFRPANQHPTIAVEHNLLPIFDVEHSGADADNHRHTKRAGHDRSVSGDPAADQRDAFRVHRDLRNIGGTERAGNDDAARHAGLHSTCTRCRAPAQAAHVVGALGEDRVSQPSQLLGALLSRVYQRCARRPAGLHDETFHGGVQSRIAGHHDARLDDVGLLVPAGLA